MQRTSSTLTPTTTPSSSGVKSLVGIFENISRSNQNKPKSGIKSTNLGFNYLNPPSSTNTSKPMLQTKITPPKLQPIIKVRGFI